MMQDTIIVPDTKDTRDTCYCPDCPSFPKSCKNEILYCAGCNSQCDIDAKGCDCPKCSIWKKYNLKGIYFCDKDRVGDGIVMRKKRANEDESFYQTVVDIKSISASAESIVRSMGSLKKMPFSLNDLHFIPAQTDKIPLDKEEEVKTEVVIGPKSKKPLKVSSPIMISGMSFGATSRNVKMVISQVAAISKIGYNSGEGGILPEEFKIAPNFIIGQYATGRFDVNEDVLKKVAAVEIRFSQGAYPGKGSFLPASKMTQEVATIRGLKGGEAAYSPAHHYDMKNPKEIKEKVSWIRNLTAGVPVGAKIGCGNVEKDVKVLVDAEVDFISLDGFGGGTGATDFYVRENVGIPIVAALPRVYKFLKSIGARDDVSIIAGGGLRTSADFAKCLALGAEAVYIGTAALIALNCEQYRICQTGLCPTGCTSHDPILVKQLDVDEGIKKLSNFVKLSTEEIANLTRIVGKNDVNKLDNKDLVSLNRDLAEIAGVVWLDGKLKRRS